jgi:hypothetical protein
MRVLKVQTTLRGYSAWVIHRLMTIKGESLADVSKYVLDRWIDDNAEFLQRFELTHNDFQLAEEGRGQIVDFERSDAE